MKTSCSKLWLFALILVPSISFGIFLGCSRPTTPQQSAPTPIVTPVVVAKEFVGSAACTLCHAKEANQHKLTGHARTLTPITEEDLGKRLPSLASIPNTKLAMQKLEDQFVVASKLTGNVFPLQLAFGSGKQGMTYSTILDDKTLFEMHYSYFPETKKWYITPGHEQEKIDPKSMGLSLSGAVPRKCILCHAVTLPENSLKLEPKFMGVGCESCHGPGSAHIAAAQTAGTKDFGMEKLSTIGGTKMNALCGQCHRSVEEVSKMPEHQRLSQRFFPYGLAMSRCFKESNDQLTCSGCHDPHTNISTDLKYYESRCLNCHASPKVSIPISAKPSLPAEKRVVCKVNPSKGCVGCHLPKKNAFPGTSLPISMADHWIRIQK